MRWLVTAVVELVTFFNLITILLEIEHFCLFELLNRRHHILKNLHRLQVLIVASVLLLSTLEKFLRAKCFEDKFNLACNVNYKILYFFIEGVCAHAATTSQLVWVDFIILVWITFLRVYLLGLLKFIDC